jgi:hypothetical protein
VNGRTDGERWGCPTRYPACSRETPSLLDYTLCSAAHLTLTKSFYVNPLSELSDHCCITCKIKTSQRSDEEIIHQPKTKITKGYKFDLELAGTYTQNLKDDPRLIELKNEMEQLRTGPVPQDTVDKLAEKFGNCIVDNARQTFPAKPRRPRKPLKQQKPAKWFNDQCSKLKKAYKRALTKLNKTPFDRNLKHKALVAYKAYKKACKEAEASFRGKVVEKLLELSTTDPKGFWKTLKDMREWGRETPDPSDSIQPESWKEYYQTLLNKTSTKPFKLPLGASTPDLDRPLMLKELESVIKRAKWGKAAGPDHIQIELLKFAPPEIVKVLFQLMRLIFDNAAFPKVWTVNYLRAIYKEGL